MGQRFEGRNLDEALTNASEALGVERWQFTHHILLEKRGFLGGSKRVVIEVEVNADAAPPAVAAPVVTESARPVPPPPARAPRGGDRPRGGRGRRERHDEPHSRSRRGGREQRDES